MKIVVVIVLTCLTIGCRAAPRTGCPAAPATLGAAGGTTAGEENAEIIFSAKGDDGSVVEVRRVAEKLRWTSAEIKEASEHDTCLADSQTLYIFCAVSRDGARRRLWVCHEPHFREIDEDTFHFEVLALSLQGNTLVAVYKEGGGCYGQIINRPDAGTVGERQRLGWGAESATIFGSLRQGTMEVTVGDPKAPAYRYRVKSTPAGAVWQQIAGEKPRNFEVWGIGDQVHGTK